ncbi:MAG: hypothetical protein RL077_5421, partial [Verrucomicrobiota bacterium]
MTRTLIPDCLTCPWPKGLRAFALLGAALAGLLSPPSFSAESVTTGVVSGIVTNQTTGNGLIGARVEIPALNLSALVDDT